MVRSSALADWCTKIFKDNLSERIEPKNIMVSLLSAGTDSRQATMTWKFFNAYPIKWDISSMDAQKSEIVVESITFAYQYFEKVD
jgi:phage tail-like protein